MSHLLTFGHRCEGDDIEPVECKIEEQSYHVSDWTSSHVESPIEENFESNTYHQGNHSHAVGSSHSYGRDSKWPAPLENLRISPILTRDVSWSQSSSPTLPRDGSTRRRDVSISPTTGPWPTLHSQPNRWRSDSYHHDSTSGGHSVERSRVRSNTSYEHAPSYRRESEGTPGYQHRIIDVGGSREGGSQRFPWLSSRDASIAEKYLRSPTRPESFTPSPTLPFSSHNTYNRAGQSYGTTWAANDTGSSLPNSSLHQIPAHNLHSYGTSYTSSSPEDYSVDEYGKSS